ncbi:hypothetical protein TDB9533_04311 [Thalassocella blandensis]|nr:hypothetical protein TDB9533_04311 [Thalassocella blandensis]
MHRRQFLQYCTVQTLASVAMSGVPVAGIAAQVNANTSQYLQKEIPSSGEKLNVIGMGTWQTFNVGSDEKLRLSRTKILRTFFTSGGQMIDSSPMYGSSQSVVGDGLQQLHHPKSLFAADKIWTSDGDATAADMQESLSHWQLEKFHLLQVHNLVNWQAHLPRLQALKEQGKVKYIGVTTSHGRRHDELEKIMKSHAIDFVQLTYNMTHREAESRLLPLAQEKGIAVIANRPFDGGYLVDRLKRSSEAIPDWARDLGCKNWPQFLLKYIVSHPAITCAIPATSKVVHMKENMGALVGAIPTEEQRKHMLQYLLALV